MTKPHTQEHKNNTTEPEGERRTPLTEPVHEGVRKEEGGGGEEVNEREKTRTPNTDPALDPTPILSYLELQK